MESSNIKIISFIILLIIILSNSCDITNSDNKINYHNKILFASRRTAKSQLYMMNPDGSDIKQITFEPYWHDNGRWSPSAEQIVCNTEENSTTVGFEMVVMNSNGSNRKFLDYGSEMSWHPEGSKIVFSFMPSAEIGDLSSYIYLVNSDGTNCVRITNNIGVKDKSPRFSPDGEVIAFSSDRDFLTGKLSTELYLMNKDGSDQRRITFSDSVINLNPCWSEDGSKIVYNSNGRINEIEISEQRTHTICSSNEYLFVEPCYSLNGENVIFIARNTDGSEKSHLYIVNIDGTNLYRIIEDSFVTSCDWSK